MKNVRKSDVVDVEPLFCSGEMLQAAKDNVLEEHGSPLIDDMEKLQEENEHDPFKIVNGQVVVKDSNMLATLQELDRIYMDNRNIQQQESSEEEAEEDDEEARKALHRMLEEFGEEIARLKAHDDEAEQLISDHIPHFLKTWKRSKKRGQSTKAKAPEPIQSVAVGDDVPNFLDSNGRFSEQLISDYESNLTEKAYGDIIKSRSHDTSITYNYKQLKFLFFYRKFYAGRPAISRFQVRDTKLLAFLMREVVEREVPSQQ
ncbi:hypothetical protein [Parasitella parasitica]|uniref:Uncharacterized protein n=1 Tax=Parasitella parasitica TaxID=35722 RepID=A0A0B7NF57_9FUNG|nr:hypothetical protein [Parasitella parasitica]